MKIDNWVKVIMDSLYDGVLIADADSIVRYVNKSYTKITNVPYEEIVGKSLNVRPGSQLQNVLKTGEQLLGVHRKVENREYIVNMVPIFEDGRVTGGISLLNDISDIVEIDGKAQEIRDDH